MLRYSAGAKDNQFSVTAMAYQGAWYASTQVPQRAVDSGALPPFGAVDPSDGGSTARYSLSFDLARRNAGGQFHASAYAVRSDLTLFGNYTYYLDDPVNGDQARQTERRRMLGFDVSQIHPAETRSFRVTVKAAW